MAPGARALFEVSSRGPPSVPREVQRPGLNRPHDRESSTPTAPNTTSQVFATGPAAKIILKQTGHSSLWSPFKEPIKSEFSWEWGEGKEGFFFPQILSGGKNFRQWLPSTPPKFTPDERIGIGP